MILGCTANEVAAPAGPSAALASATVDDTEAAWVGFSPTASVYLNYVAGADGTLTGFVQISRLDDAGLSLEPESSTLTGTINDGQIVITTLGQTWTGVLTADTLVLTFPRQDGTVGQMTLIRGSVDDFNAAVARLAQEANAATEVAVASSIAAAEANAATAEANAATAQLTKLFGDIRSATITLEDLTSSLPGEQQWVDDAVSDVERAADDARDVFMSCEELPYSVDSVVYAVEGVTYAVDSVNWAIEDLRRQQASVSALAAQLDPIADSDDTAFAVFAAEEAVLAADSAIETAIALYESSFDAANEILVSVGSEAARACPSLTPPGPVTTQA